MEKQNVYSEKMRANSGRTYFFDLRQAENGHHYICLTQSRRDKDNDGKYLYENILIFSDDVEAFNSAFERLVDNYRHQLKSAPSPSSEKTS